MFDGTLPGIRSFASADLVRKMADERNVLFVGFIGESEIRVARNAVVNFDEVGAAGLDVVDGAPGFLGLVHDDGTGPDRWITVDDRTAKNNFRPGGRGGKFGAQL